MKKMLMMCALCAVFAMGLGLAAFAAPTVTSVTAQQRYPWNGLVDIVVTFNGEQSDVAKATCSFAATNSATKAALAIAHVTQVGTDAGSGNVWTRRFLWDTNADVGEVKITDVALVAEIKAVGDEPSGSGGVQLWEGGPYWAECNVGASKPEEYGSYFMWGDTVGYKPTGKWFSGNWFTSENCPTYGKTDSELRSLGYIDSVGNLTTAHDAATTHLGVPWRMPTGEEFDALVNNCGTTWTMRNGVYGRLVTGKGAYASKSIFLPAAGGGGYSYLGSAGSNGYYWSSTLGSDYSMYAWCLEIDSDRFGYVYGYYSWCGRSVRPVREFAQMTSSAASCHYALDNRTGVRVAGVLEQIRFSPAWETDSAVAVAIVSTNGVAMKTSPEEGAFLWTPSRNGIYEFSHAVVIDGVQVGETLTAKFEVSGMASVISIDKADVSSIDLSWSASGFGEGTKYAVYRGTNTDINAANCIALGITDLHYSDTQWSRAYDRAPMLTYWVLAQEGARSLWSEMAKVDTPKVPLRIKFETGQGTVDARFADWCAWGCECDTEWHYNDEKVWVVPGTHHVVFHAVKEGKDEQGVKRNWPAIFLQPMDMTVTVNSDTLSPEGVFLLSVEPSNCRGRVRFSAVGQRLTSGIPLTEEEYAKSFIDISKCSVRVRNNATGQYIDLPMDCYYFLSDGSFTVEGLYDGERTGAEWFYEGDKITLDTAKLFDDSSGNYRDIKLAYARTDEAKNLFRCKFDVNASDAVVDVQYMTVLNGTSFADAFPVPRRKGYRFVGWFTERVNGKDADSFYPGKVDLNSLERASGDAVAYLFYAHWEEVNTGSDDGQSWYYRWKDGALEFFGMGDAPNVSAFELVEVDIPSSIEDKDVVSIGNYAFYDNEQIETVSIPSSVLNIGINAFKGCDNLTGVTFKGALPNGVEESHILDGVTEVYYPRKYADEYEAVVPAELFAGYTDEEEVKPDGSYSETIDGYTWYYDVKDGEATIVAPDEWGWIEIDGDLVIPDTLGGCPVVGIGEGALYNSFVTAGVVIPDSVESIGGYAFNGMITNLSIGASVNAISNYAFSSAQVKHIALDSANECFVLRNGALYTADLTELLLVSSETEELVLPAEMTSPIDRTFAYCPSIASFGVEDGNERYEVRNGLLYDTENDSVVCAPRIGGACAVPDGTKVIRSYAFAGCGYQNVLLPEGLLAIEDIAFSNCTNLEEATLPDSLLYVGYGAFQNTALLADDIEIIKANAVTAPLVLDGWLLGYYYGADFNGKLVVPEGVKALAVLSIADDRLTDLTLPASVDIINEYALNCYSLKAIRFKGDAPTRLGAYCQCGELMYTYDIFSETDVDVVSYVRNDALGWTDDDELPALWPLNPDYPESTYNARAIRYWMPSCTVIAGAKCDVDVGLKGYATKTLPKGLSYNAKTGYVTGTAKTTGEYEVTFTKKNEPDVVMTFVVRAEATPTVACVGLAEGAFVVGVAGGASGIPLDIGAESGVKSVKATKLPTGMKLVQDKVSKNWSITGAPTKAGEYDVVIEVTTVAGGKASQTIHVEVAALPTAATGTFNGFVLSGALGDRALPDGETVNRGTLQVTVSDVGKVTAKVVDAAGTYSFTAAGWDSVSEGIYSVKMTTKKGENLELALDTAKGWNEHQLTGSFAAVGMAALSVEAQKNAFGKQWFFNATGDEKNGWELSFADNAKTADLTVTLNADGKTSVAGKLGSYKITASGYVDVSGIGSGALFADFAPVVTVGKSKKVLSLRANLWFDKKSDHENGVGSAIFVD